MPAGDYVVGLLFLAGTLGGVGLGARLVVRRRLAHLSGSPLVVAYGLLVLTGIIAVHLVPAALGVLTRGTVLAAAGLLLLGLTRVRAVPATPEAPPRQEPPSSPLSWALAGAAVGIVAAFAVAVLWHRAAVPITAWDALTFRMPGVVDWIRDGSIWTVHSFFPDYAFGQYPQNGDLLLLAAVLPWHNDAFVRLVDFPLLALAGLSVYALARELAAPRAAGVTFAAVVVAVPVAIFPALEEAQTDALMLAAFGAGLLFLARHARTARRSDLVLAGLGLGLSFGTKWYALGYVAAVVVIWVAGRWLASRSARAPVRDALVLSGIVAASGGFWLVRNLVDSGNPLFPLKVAPAGVTIFDAPTDTIRERVGFAAVHYLDQPSVWFDYLFPGWFDLYQLPSVVLIAGLALALAMAVAARHATPREVDPRLMALALIALAVAVVFFFTPNSAIGPEGRPVNLGASARYAVPAFLAAAPCVAWAVGRIGRLGLVLELAAVVAVVDGLRRAFPFAVGDLAGPALLVALALGALLAWRWSGGRLALGGPRLAAAGAVAIVALAVAGNRLQHSFNSGRYQAVDPTYDRVLSETRSGGKVALTGLWSDQGPAPDLPLVGSRLQTEVDYVGRLDKHMPRTFRRRDELAGALRRGRYRLVLAGRAGPPPRPRREERWLRSLGYERVARSDRFSLYRAPTR